ncbi:3'-5' exoribonuclease domain-containing protein [Vibrio porteresiae]|uniref:3'-5' exoribonuclease n=1 Tax=Vibrio porteresiae DSM 19223 TaxID=1123496 RepID=A0ABZ0Q973_9VIBR|nr:3'-5' exoribonuclease [Vibrio porteresiae]WPC72974.1 3'-5' exoribonuclease [Vibrio porteresiae DSM 19223]
MSEINDTTVFDTETCGLSDKSVILTLSAVRFNRNESKLALDRKAEFHASLSIPEQLLKQRVIEPGTMKWWDKQSEDAKSAAFFGSVIGKNKDILEKFFQFISGSQLFCRGTDFDPPKLISLCKDFDVEVPYKYNQYRDVRTYIDAFTDGNTGYLDDQSLTDDLIPHNSLHDCWRDAIQMVRARQIFIDKII